MSADVLGIKGDTRATRNGLPVAAAEAEHGLPVFTCYCGRPIRLRSGYGTCRACGRVTGPERRQP
jgi:hypothetical protein